MPQKVIIVGGGIAGLTAAHELIERNFDVTVYERRPFFGGKAASIRLDPAPGEMVGRPGEHGFRFFAHWYKHVPDTMSRIPFRGRGNVGPERSVADHLAACDENVMVRYRGGPTPVVLRPPRSADQAQALGAFIRQVRDMRLPASEIAFFFQTLAKFLELPESERRRVYDEVSWWKLVDAENRTAGFRELIVAATQYLLAARPKESSAYTIASLAVRTLFAQPLARDRVLDGPTNEVWIDPWIGYLKARGVKFQLGYQLDAIELENRAPKIGRLRFSSVADNVAFKWARQAQRSRAAGAGEPQQWLRRAELLVNRLGADDRLLRDPTGIERYVPTASHADQADYYVFALPVEQMAYFINRSASLALHDETLQNIVTLAGSTEWMAGIQFYLSEALPRFPRGHVVCSDTEWALTAREQTHLWRDTPLPARVRSLLTVDISEWNRPGRAIVKEASRCTREEVAREVWHQLQACFNRDDEELLRDGMLLGKGPADPASFYLDDDIVELFDRRKQAAYSRAAALRASSDQLLSQAAREQDAAFAFGDRATVNLEPLLINRPGALARRPSAATGVHNMFLAGDYLDTRTNLACMEGANEAGRLAVNAILERTSRGVEPCRIHGFEDGEVLARITGWASALRDIPAARHSVELAASAADVLGAVAGRFGEVMRSLGRRP